MTEIMQLVEKLFQMAPGPAALIFCAFIFYKIKEKEIQSKKDEAEVAKVNGTKYVLKNECHGHIDGMKMDMTLKFSEIREDIHDLHDKMNITNLAVARIEGKMGN